MLLIDCPYCGPRPETEFHCGGQAHVARPDTPADVNDHDWGAYLYERDNPRGIHSERWNHLHGCGRWFNALRDTLSDRFIETYPMGARPKSAQTPEVRA